MTTTSHSKMSMEFELDDIASRLGLVRGNHQDADGFASCLHYRIDDLVREHARDIGAQKITDLLDLHDTIERLVP